MSRFETELKQVLASVRALPGRDGPGVTVEPAIPVLASPNWRAIDKTTGKSLFVKLMDADAALYIDLPSAFACRGSASTR